MEIIDTHVHYNLAPLWPDWRSHWRQAQLAGVTHSLVVGTDVETSQRAVTIAGEQSELKAAIGIHPTTAGEAVETITLKWLQVQFSDLLDLPIVAAIGETGLDYFHLRQSTLPFAQARDKQLASLRAHLQLARIQHLPIILHVRDSTDQAYVDMLDVLKSSHQLSPCILHCASGPAQYIAETVELGAYVSFAGNCTYPSATHSRQLVGLVPTNRLLFETDAPFLPPQTHRGQSCEPAWITETAQFLHDELGVDTSMIHRNSQQLLGW